MSLARLGRLQALLWRLLARVERSIDVDSTYIRTVLFLFVLGLALILLPEIGRARELGPVGWLLLQAAGAFGIARARHQRGPLLVTWILLVAFVANSFALLLVYTRLTGPQIWLIATVLLSIFFAGLAGGLVAAIVLAGRVLSGSPRPPVGPAFAGAAVAIALSTTVAVATPPGPTPPATLTPFPTIVAATARPTPTGAPTPTNVATFPLTIVVNGTGTAALASGLACTSRCSIPIVSGTVVNLAATPGAGQIFAGWQGCDSRGACTIRVTGPREVQATFRQPVLRVATGGKAKGTVASEPKGILCPPTCESGFAAGTRVSLRPSPSSGAAFTGWSLGCDGFTCDIRLVADSEVQANFETAASGALAALAGESAFQNASPESTVSLSVQFRNAGNTTWGANTPAQLAVCCPLGGPSPLASWNAGWLSPQVYTQQAATNVAPGGIATFTFYVRVPSSAQPGTTVRFDGILVDARSGAPIAGGTVSVSLTVK